VSTSPLFGPPRWSVDAVDSIRILYPRKVNKKVECQRIKEALDRICNGEIDGKARSEEQAVLYLRERTEAAKQKFAGRPRKLIPHATTFYHQRRYLQLQQAVSLDGLSQERITMAVNVLSVYPGVGKINLDDLNAYAALLLTVDEELTSLTKPPSNRDSAYEYLLKKVKLFANCVAEWPQEDWKFIPSPENWFKKKQYEQDARRWIRNGNATSGYQAEREQLLRVTGAIRSRS